MENTEMENGFEDEEIVEENEVYSSDESDDSQEEQETKKEITLEDYYKLKERLKKAEKTIVAQKKEAKAKPVMGDDVMTKTDYIVNTFIDKNPQFEGKEEEIKGFLKKGLTIQQIQKLVEPDSSYENREKTKRTSISQGDFSGSITSYSTSDLEKLSQKDYENVMNLYEKGKVKITG